MDIFEAIQTRRSVRDFSADKIPKGDLEKILNMGRYAPTAGNIQPWKFLLLKKINRKGKFKEKLAKNIARIVEELAIPDEEKKLRKKNTKEALNNIFNAALIILLFVDTNTYPDLVIYDGALAAQNIMLAAHALGYGSSFQTSFFPERIVKDFFRIPEHYKFICALPIGKVGKKPIMPEKKPLEELTWKD
ncbi:MAG: nitroreductase family protein [Candidatus Heimdallarchaeota archaeon]|nr:MAG: nitroreductase family protein [Candidatus Heimdallarchaeota archaeon]